MSKEGYSQKGYTAYHGEPLGSATENKSPSMKGDQKGNVPYKGGVTMPQGKYLGSTVKGKG